MGKAQVHHIMIGDRPYCDHLGCQAGMDVASKTGIWVCDAPTGSIARQMAKDLRPHFKRGVVKVVAGHCPAMRRAP